MIKDRNRKEKKSVKSKNSKIIILIFLIILIILTVFGIIYFNKDEDAQDGNNNINKEFFSNKEIDNVTFTNIVCSFDGFNSLLTYTVTNNSMDSIFLEDYELIVKDKDSNILAVMVPGDSKELSKNESINIENIIDIDLTKAYSLELRLSN